MKSLLIKIPLYLLIAFLVLNILTVGASVATYKRLSDESLVAQLRFEEMGPQHYRAHLVSLDIPGAGHTYEIKGDQWQLDAQFMKVKPWANVLGIDAYYRLDRLQGRYRDIGQQTEVLPTAYALSLGQGNWLAGFFDNWDWLVVVADAEYGSATYATIETGKLYSVYRTQSGLITRVSP